MGRKVKERLAARHPREIINYDGLIISRSVWYISGRLALNRYRLRDPQSRSPCGCSSRNTYGVAIRCRRYGRTNISKGRDGSVKRCCLRRARTGEKQRSEDRTETPGIRPRSQKRIGSGKPIQT